VALEDPEVAHNLAGGSIPVTVRAALPRTDSPHHDNVVVTEDERITTNMDTDIEVETMILEPTENWKKSSPTNRTLSRTPAGGLLNIRDVPDEDFPAKETLRIEMYSNAIYWQFAPYLESVRCGTRRLRY
jgi:hypothetical protein